MLPLLILTACSTTQNQKIKRLSTKEVIQPQNYSCTDITMIINNHKFDVEPLTKLYKKCPNQKTKVALLIAKGDKYYRNKNYKEAYRNYTEALSLIQQNNLEIFDEYLYYLKRREAEYVFQNDESSIDRPKGDILDSQTLEGYIRPRGKTTRGADVEEFNRLKGIPLNFATGSSVIEGGNLAQAKEIGKLLSKKDYKDRTIYITGYTDTRGDSASNQELSIKRAEGLKSYLINNFGLKEDNIRAEGYGESFPICSFGNKQKSKKEYSCTGQENYDRSRRVTLEYGE